MEDTKNIERILSQVKTISKSYDRLNESNGGNFNIFSILKIESDEVKTHSRFISELLNPNGVHGYGSDFLRLFIDVLGIKGLEKMNPSNCYVSVEAYQGPVEETKGGSIDILIKEDNSDENVIMIENKIYAGEQYNQLLRYSNAYPKGKLLFLTLDGRESEDENSKDINYESISYKDDIINWLEKCREISVTNPTLRETLTQYINLLKKLTYQNINTKMNEELVQLLTENEENFEAFKIINNLDIKKALMEKVVIPAFKELEKEIDGFSYNHNIERINSRYHKLCIVENAELTEKKINIVFEFQKKNADFLIGGFCYLNADDKTKYDYSGLQEEFKNIFKVDLLTSQFWPAYFHYWNYMNWNTNLDDVKNFFFKDFKADIKGKIEEMLKMTDKIKIRE